MFRLNVLKRLGYKNHTTQFQYFRCFGWIINKFKQVFICNSQFQYFRCFGWILYCNNILSTPPMFQYFRCFGWMKKNRLKLTRHLMFQYFRCFGWINVPNVYVQLLARFQYFRCFGWIKAHFWYCKSKNDVSILQMFRLNFDLFHFPSLKVLLFQYFRCFGWIFSR